MSTPVDNSISRSGRVRKKTAKLMEMEVGDVPGVPGSERTPLVKAPAARAATTASTPRHILSPGKKPLKIKLTLGGTPVIDNEPTLEELQEPFEDEDDDEIEEEVDPLPPIRMKLNASKGTAEIDTVKKTDKNESAANKLFKQITSGFTPSVPTPPKKKKVPSIIIKTENLIQPKEEPLEPTSVVTAPDIPQTTLIPSKNSKNLKTSTEKRPPPKKAKMKTVTPSTSNGGGDASVKKKTFMTAYTLWSRENRKTIAQSSPGMDFSTVSKRLGEVWQAVPKNEKLQWKRRAQKLSGKLPTGTIISTGAPLPPVYEPPAAQRSLIVDNLGLSSGTINLNTPLNSSYASHLISSDVALRPVGTDALDVAAHLKILGESLGLIGQRLTEHNGQIAVSGTLSLLLDSTLCALGPLLCLTTLSADTDGCPRHVHESTLENISYIMPGI